MYFVVSTAIYGFNYHIVYQNLTDYLELTQPHKKQNSTIYLTWNQCLFHNKYK